MVLTHQRRVLCVTTRKTLTLPFFAQLKNEVELVSAAKAADGYRLARSQQFDLFLIGDKLHTGSGIELCKMIRAFDARTPTVLLLSGGSKHRMEKAQDAQAQLVFSAPYDAEVLLKAKAIRGLITNTGK